MILTSWLSLVPPLWTLGRTTKARQVGTLDSACGGRRTLKEKEKSLEEAPLRRDTVVPRCLNALSSDVELGSALTSQGSHRSHQTSHKNSCRQTMRTDNDNKAMANGPVPQGSPPPPSIYNIPQRAANPIHGLSNPATQH